MLRTLFHRLPNLTPVLLVLGSTAIAMSLWAPVLTGHRVARSEERADAFTEAILVAGIASQPFAFDHREDVDRVVEAIYAACTELEVPRSRIPKFEGGTLDPKGICLYSKHYCFLLTRRPPPTERKADYDPDAFELLEAYGWPRLISSPGQTAFYHGERDRSSFTRNLISKYVGEKVTPKGGHAREVSRFDNLREKHHRGAKEERWLHAPVAIRVNRIAGALMRVALQNPFDGPMGNARGESLSGALRPELEAAGIWRLFDPDLVEAETSEDRLVWQDRQYSYCLLRNRSDEASSLEVYAWPREDLHPPGLVIFYPESGEPAVSENNDPELSGTTAVPLAGDGVWKAEPDEHEQTLLNSFYLGGRGRWIRFANFEVRTLVNER